MEDISKDTKKVLEVTINAGKLLLQNGAEIFRAEQTMAIMFESLGVKSYDFFVISDGIFATVDEGGEEHYAKVRHIPVLGIHLGRVTALNNLSREIAAGEVALEEAEERLKEIEGILPHEGYFRMLAASIGSGSFSYLLGGSIWDCFASAAIAFILYLFVIKTEHMKLSKIVVNIVGGVLITVCACIVSRIIPALQLDKILVGSVMPLIPGVAFINAIRNLADSDFISGTVRMIDAVLAFISIAVGVGSTLSVFQYLFGLGGI